MFLALCVFEQREHGWRFSSNMTDLLAWWIDNVPMPSRRLLRNIGPESAQPRQRGRDAANVLTFGNGAGMAQSSNRLPYARVLRSYPAGILAASDAHAEDRISATT